MNKLKKSIWFSLGIMCLGLAYVGVIVPGFPWSTPLIMAAYCFSKSSERMHNWILNHKLFGPFVKNWRDKKIYPNKAKWAMAICMDVSLILIWVATQNWKLTVGVGIIMMICAIFAWRYPGSISEYERRKAAGEKIGWFG